MKKLIFIAASFFLLSAKSVLAFCPVCTVAVGAGVGLSRYFGIDDTITGLWVGGLLVSVSFWTIDWLRKKKVQSPWWALLVFLFYYGTVIIPMYYMEIVGHPFNRFWGMDKLILGLIIGSIVFYLTGAWYHFLKKKNGGRAYFPLQKVVMPVSSLIIFSVFFYFLTR
ncbi:MAG TPA: hypothetical protein PKI61_00105 [bacterium]|nr:hypothetical protein [bacterium]HPT29452.1 hypothetical protein [bacterium]